VYLCAHYSSENEYDGVCCHGTSSPDVVVFLLKNQRKPHPSLLYLEFLQHS